MNTKLLFSLKIMLIFSIGQAVGLALADDQNRQERRWSTHADKLQKSDNSFRQSRQEASDERLSSSREEIEKKLPKSSNPSNDHRRSQNDESRSERKHQLREQNKTALDGLHRQNERKTDISERSKRIRESENQVKEVTRTEANESRITSTGVKEERKNLRSNEEIQRGDLKLQERYNRRVEEDRIKREKKVRVPEEHRNKKHVHKHKLYKRHRHVYYDTPWYNTWYLAPIHIHYHPIGHRLRLLPQGHIKIFINGAVYFYFAGIFYQSYNNGFVVVSAPIGGTVNILPDGFIAFSSNDLTYFFVNDTYYQWDDSGVSYVVVEKPSTADDLIRKETKGRLYVYPKNGQDEQQQAKDRYTCHQWAVSQSGVDPTKDEDKKFSAEENKNYKRAISACLEGNGYVVK